MNAMTFPRAATVTVSELVPAVRVSLRIADPAAAGLAPDARIGARVGWAGGAALRLGPDEWLVETPESGREAVFAALAAVTAPHSAVEVSDREITLRLEGPAALDLLATGCPRDLSRMPVGAGARTVFDTVQVVLTREAEDRFHMTLWRSYAPHLRALLDIAAREIAAGL
jgi:sarcosine oxidase subunit gamma